MTNKFLTLDDTGKKKDEAQGVSSTTGVNEANSLISTDADGFIDPSFLRETESISRPTSENIDALDFVNVYDDGGTPTARKADASAFGTRAFGVVLNNVTSPAAATIQSEGVVGGFTGLTVGEPVFLSDATPGEITQTPPTASGSVWQKLGEATSATEIRLEIGEAICRV